jgi:hypothetical protein
MVGNIDTIASLRRCRAVGAMATRSRSAGKRNLRYFAGLDQPALMIRTQSRLRTRPDRGKSNAAGRNKARRCSESSLGFFHSFGGAIDILWIDHAKTEMRGAARFAHARRASIEHSKRRAGLELQN